LYPVVVMKVAQIIVATRVDDKDNPQIIQLSDQTGVRSKAESTQSGVRSNVVFCVCVARLDVQTVPSAPRYAIVANPTSTPRDG
jgi:hypothetical protein